MAFSYGASEFGELAGAEEDQRDDDDDEQFGQSDVGHKWCTSQNYECTRYHKSGIMQPRLRQTREAAAMRI